jgi:hypothetical protein
LRVRIRFDRNRVIRSGLRFLYNRSAQRTHQYLVSRQKVPRVWAITRDSVPQQRPRGGRSPPGSSQRVHTTRALVSRVRIPSADRRDRHSERAFGPACGEIRIISAWSVYRYSRFQASVQMLGLISAYLNPSFEQKSARSEQIRMHFCQPDSAHCHLKTHHLQCPRAWPEGRPPHRPLQLGRLTTPRPTPPPPPCSVVRRRVAFQRRLCLRRDLASKRERSSRCRTVEMMGDCGVDASLRDTSAAHTCTTSVIR